MNYLGTDYTDFTDFFFFSVICTIGGLENKNYLIREIRVIRAQTIYKRDYFILNN